MLDAPGHPGAGGPLVRLHFTVGFEWLRLANSDLVFINVGGGAAF